MQIQNKCKHHHRHYHKHKHEPNHPQPNRSGWKKNFVTWQKIKKECGELCRAMCRSGRRRYMEKRLSFIFCIQKCMYLCTYVYCKPCHMFSEFRKWWKIVISWHKLVLRCVAFVSMNISRTNDRIEINEFFSFFFRHKHFIFSLIFFNSKYNIMILLLPGVNA